ncbi:phosphoribosylformylglycinamidine synthase, partial [Patescibacteria group bacterium]|nr:phosphoribosylformylglycinamidine synthase [Patescibacteria group bacterium]
MAIQVISVTNKKKYPDGTAEGIISDIKEFLKIDHVENLKIVKKYYLEGLNKEEAEKMASLVLSEDLWQDATLNEEIHQDADFTREVAYRPGMMNPEVESIIEAAKDLGLSLIAADTSFKYCFYGSDLHENEVNEIVNR